ncbi:MAG: manganese-dependent ADP-ribose/CDP-alcohol diphosphatase [Kiritimatiellia bacterium]|jgi:manganese-dependent ADP-ribose/CDP-alcohol diphosphatase
MRRFVAFLTLFCALVGAEEAALWQFGAMADCQYCDKAAAGQRLYRQSPAKLANCVERYNQMDLAYVVHLGDFIDDDWKSFDVLAPITAKLKHPLYHVLGNHDFSVADDKKLMVPAKLGMPSRYYDFKVQNWRFIVVDGNDLSLHGWPKDSSRNRKSREQYEQKYKGKPTYNGAVGSKQLTWIDTQLRAADEAGENVVLFCHFPVYPVNPHNLWNDEAVLAVLEKHASVKAWINGHNHAGHYGEKAGIHYLTLKGMVDTEETSYASIKVYKDRLEVTGYGRQEDFVLKL